MVKYYSNDNNISSLFNYHQRDNFKQQSQFFKQIENRLQYFLIFYYFVSNHNFISLFANKLIMKSHQISYPFHNNHQTHNHRPQYFIPKDAFHNTTKYSKMVAIQRGGIKHLISYNPIPQQIRCRTKTFYERQIPIQIPTQIKVVYVPFEKKYIQYENVQKVKVVQTEKYFLEVEETVTKKRYKNIIGEIQSNKSNQQIFHTKRTDRKIFNKTQQAIISPKYQQARLRQFYMINPDNRKKSLSTQYRSHFNSSTRNSSYLGVNHTGSENHWTTRQQDPQVIQQSPITIEESNCLPTIRYYGPQAKQQQPVTTTSIKSEFKPYLYNNKHSKIYSPSKPISKQSNP